MSGRLLLVLSKLHYAANAITPSNKLPPELLRAVFSYLRPGTHHDWEEGPVPPYRNILTVGCVCRHWREIAVSATELWTNIILGASSVPAEKEMQIALLCMRRSGAQPLDFFGCPPPLGPPEVIPELDCRRLRSIVSWRAGEATGGGLADFLRPALQLEHLEIRGDGTILPPLFSDTPRRLRELVLFRSTPWPNNQFGSLL